MKSAKQVPAGEFKAKCLKLMDRVQDTGEELVITKHGKPVAKLVPVETKPRKSSFGFMKGSIEIKGDIVGSVLEEDWEEKWLERWDEQLADTKPVRNPKT